MAENKNTVASRIHGLSPGNFRKPVLVDTFKYHMIFEDQDSAYKLVGTMARQDESTFVSTKARKNTFLIYNPSALGESGARTFKTMEYYECVKILYGPYGTDYYVFGNGDIQRSFPEVVS